MITVLARERDLPAIAELDCHISPHRLAACIREGSVYVLRETAEDDTVMGVLRFSLFWQSIPFLDLIFLRPSCRRRGFGQEMMRVWEREMLAQGCTDVMTSTQADEDAWRFYEKLGYRRAGGFFPPGQTAEEWIYRKKITLDGRESHDDCGRGENAYDGGTHESVLEKPAQN